MTNEESGETVPEDNNQQIQNIDQENMIVANPAPTFRYVFKKLMSYDLIACYGYIITFALFPNASIEQKLFDIGEYNSVTVIALYNAFDTIGRYLVKYLNPTKRKNFIIIRKNQKSIALLIKLKKIQTNAILKLFILLFIL